MTAELPTWVWDVLIDLDTQRDEHPTLLFKSGAFEGTAKYDWCPCQPLQLVPPEVIAQARAIRQYTRDKERDAPEPTDAA